MMIPTVERSHSAAGSFWLAAQEIACTQFERESKFQADTRQPLSPWRSQTGRMLPTVKLMVTARRRPELTVEAFHDYWLNEHGPLMIRVGSALRVQRYVQNHSFDSEAGRMFLGGRDADQASFDGLAEGWWRSERDMIEAFSSSEGQEASRLLAEDERKFCTGDNLVLVAYEYEFIKGQAETGL